MNAKWKKKRKNAKTGLYPFRAAVIRGLGVVVPPLFTVVIFIWVGTTVQTKVLEPVSGWTRGAIVWAISRNDPPVYSERDLSPEQFKTLQAMPVEERAGFKPVINGVRYGSSKGGGYVPDGFRDLGDGTAVPVEVHAEVANQLANLGRPPTADEIYGRFVENHYLNPYLVIPCFLSLFILLLYLLGKFIAASIGRFFWRLFERGVGQVPLVSNVYGAVKQISDLFLQERELEYSQIVAVEWPRKGIWTVALVTGESMIDIEAAANEPVLSILVPTSPVPATGFALTVKKSETIDLNISLDQAIQFIVSGGVVVPPGQIRDPNARKNALNKLAAPDDSSQSESDEQA